MTLFKGELRRWLFRVLPIILVVCCPENLSARLGGGGGYSGGGGGAWSGSVTGYGGGAGSYNNGANQSNSADNNSGHGIVVVTKN